MTRAHFNKTRHCVWLASAPLGLFCSAITASAQTETPDAQAPEVIDTEDPASEPAPFEPIPPPMPEEPEPPEPEASPEVGPQAQPQAQEDVETLVITGSRIPRTNVTAPTPVTSLSADDIDNTGAVFLNDIIAQIPQLQPNFTAATSTNFIGTGGLGLLNLRSLGSERTLVLVNGRRHVGATSLGSSIDINTIPQDLIARIEILTGGASATYGSDAVAGVVNFILKEDFEGIVARANTGISGQGDTNSVFASLTAGSNFDNDRGNAVVSLEFTRRSRLQGIDRDFASTPLRTLNNPADTETADNPDFDDGIPDEIILPDGGLSLINRNGVVRFGDKDERTYTFNSDGTMRPYDFGTKFANNEQVGGDYLRNRGLTDLLPQQERLTTTTLLSYDIVEGYAELYGEAKLVLTRSDGGSQSPSFDFGSSNELSIFRDNAYLPTALGQVMDELGETSARVNRFNIDLGRRSQLIERTTLRGVAGVRGDVNDNISYDVGLSWGRTNAVTEAGANRVNARFHAASDAVVDQNGLVNGRPGEVVCRVNLQEAQGVTPTLPGGQPAPAYALRNNLGNCVPMSVFGDGAIGRGAQRFINAPTNLTNTVEQVQLMGFVTATSDGYFELPGGPMGMVLGAEYRRDAASELGDLANTLDLTFFNAISPSDGSIDVGEVFGEVSLPILGGIPGVEELSLTAGGRISNYSLEQVGTVAVGQLNGVYRPLPDFTLRGSFASSVRAPTVGDAFSGLSQNFFGVSDPCDEDEITNAGANRVRNCQALAGKVGFSGFDPGTTDIDDDATREGVSGGNPDLEEEKSRSWTLGGVITPRWVPGLSFTLDYYNFVIEDAIGVPGAQRILDNCVDLPSIDNQFCDLITRSPTNFEVTNIRSVSINLAALETEGVDFEVVYNFALEDAADLVGLRTGDVGQLQFRLNGNHVLRYTNFPDQDNRDEEENLAGFFGSPPAIASIPEWRWNFYSNYIWEDFTFTYRFNIQGGFSRADDQEFLDENPDFQDPARIKAKWFHNVQARYRALEQLEVYAGIDNIFNQEPPFGLNGTDTGLYDPIGRFFYAGVRAQY